MPRPPGQSPWRWTWAIALIDTAENYENERGVGEGIRRSGVARGEVFVTTKFNRKWHSVEGARQACEASLERLGLDYIDLFLVHWPNPDQGRYVEAFEGLVKLREAGLVRHRHLELQASPPAAAVRPRAVPAGQPDPPRSLACAHRPCRSA